MKQKLIAFFLMALLALPLAASALPCSACSLGQPAAPGARDSATHPHCSDASKIFTRREASVRKHFSCPQSMPCMASAPQTVQQELRQSTASLSPAAATQNRDATPMVTPVTTPLDNPAPLFPTNLFLALRI